MFITAAELGPAALELEWGWGSREAAGDQGEGVEEAEQG